MDRLHDPAIAAQKSIAAIAEFFAGRLGDCPVSHFVDPHLHQQGDTEGQEALPFLLNWLRRPLDGLPYCAIFGRLGMARPP